MRSPLPPVLDIPAMPSPVTSTRVILVRHGRSTFNDQGRYQGSSDESVLTDLGKSTAYQVGQALEHLEIDAIYASPLKRVRQTVDAIVDAMIEGSEDALETPIHWTPQLREIDLPDWEGLPFKQVREERTDEYRCWKNRPHEFQMAIAGSPTAVEFPVLNLYQRAAQFWQDTLPRHRGQTLLVVSHGGTNHALISTALGLSPAHYHTLQQSNCGVSVLEFPAGRVDTAELRSLNLTHLLGETLPKLKEGKQGLRLLLVPVSHKIHHCEQLAEQLRLPLSGTAAEAPAIDFCLDTHVEQSQSMIRAILQHHPRTVQLQATCENFPQLWQQSMQEQQTHSPRLITGLVVSDVKSIQDIVGQAIGLSADQRWRINLQRGALSVVHYPAVNHHPVLQALNFSGEIFSEMITLNALDRQVVARSPR